MSTATKATIYLGANVPGEPRAYSSFRGKVVTDTDFSLFLDDYVSPRFPGFTVRETTGYWRGMQEKSWELVILAGDALVAAEHGVMGFHDLVEQIARAYKEKFRQEAVMISYESLTVQWDVPDREPLCKVGERSPVSNACGVSRAAEGWVSPEERGMRDEGSERFDVV